MITYLYSFPDTFAVIKLGNKNFLFADIFNIHAPEYVSETDVSDNIGSVFLWSADGGVGLTREKYDSYMVAYSDNFNDRDVRYLLGFQNKDIVSRILSKFQTMFREQKDKGISLTDLRTGRPFLT